MSVNLDAEDLRNLVMMLSTVPQLTTEDQRRQMLLFAGLEQLTPHIDISGQAFVAVTTMVTSLGRYGRLPSQQEALGVFLNTLIEMDFIRDANRKMVNKLLSKYSMILPVAISDTSFEISSPIDISLEKIIGENTLRPIAFLAEGVRVSRSICYIAVTSFEGSGYTGTGFLITPSLVMTNHHILPSHVATNHAIVRFNFEETASGAIAETAEFRCKADGIFHSNSQLDYAIVELEHPVGEEWGYLPLRANVHRPEVGKRVNIIQHPGGRPKHVSLQNNFVEYVDDLYLQYVTATQPGSSGSPVLNDLWQPVALHHGGGNIQEPSTNLTYFRNQGVRITAILKDLPEHILMRINAIYGI